PSEIRLLWQDRSQSELGYRVLMSSAETGPYAEVATTGPDATAVLLTDLPSGVTRWFHVEPIAPAGLTGLPETSVPTVRVDTPERLTDIMTDTYWAITVNGSTVNHGEAGYTATGSAAVSADNIINGYGVVAAESAPAAVWLALSGSAIVTDWSNDVKEYVISDSGAYKVGTAAALEEEIGGAGYHGFERPAGVLDGQWLLILEDTYEWAESDYKDLDYDDFYWLLEVYQIPDAINSTSTNGDPDEGDGTPWTGEFIKDDSGEDVPEITLRSFIQYANVEEGSQTASFNIPQCDPGYADGVWTISESSLPTITDELMVAGATQPGYSASPVVILSGSGGSGTGFDSQASVLGVDALRVTGFGTAIAQVGASGELSLSNSVLDAVDVGARVETSGSVDVTISDSDLSGVTDISLSGVFSAYATGAWTVQGTELGGTVGVKVDGSFNGSFSASDGTIFSSDTGVSLEATATLNSATLFEFQDVDFFGINGLDLQGTIDGGQITFQDGRFDVSGFGIGISGSWQNTPLLDIKGTEFFGLTGIDINAQLNSGNFDLGASLADGTHTTFQSDTGVWLQGSASIGNQVLFQAEDVDFFGVKGLDLQGTIDGGQIKFQDGQFDVSGIGIGVNGSWQNTPLLDIKGTEFFGLTGIDINAQLNSGHFDLGASLADGTHTTFQSDTGVWLQGSASIGDQVLFEAEKVDFFGVKGLDLQGTIDGGQITFQDGQFDVSDFGIGISGTWQDTPLLAVNGAEFFGLTGIDINAQLNSGSINIGASPAAHTVFNSDSGIVLNTNADVGVSAEVNVQDADFAGVKGLELKAGSGVSGSMTVDGATVQSACDWFAFGNLILNETAVFKVSRSTDTSTYGIKTFLEGAGRFRIDSSTFENPEAALDLTGTTLFFGKVEVIDNDFFGMPSAFQIRAEAQMEGVFSLNTFQNTGAAINIGQTSAAAGCTWTIGDNDIYGGGPVGRTGILMDLNSSSLATLLRNTFHDLEDGIRFNSSLGEGHSVYFTTTLNTAYDTDNGFTGRVGGEGEAVFSLTGDRYLRGSGHAWCLESYLFGGTVNVFGQDTTFDGYWGGGIRFLNFGKKASCFADFRYTDSINNGSEGLFLIGVKFDFSLHDCDFSGNTGAGMVVDADSDGHVETSTFNDNGAAGILVKGDGILDVETSTISGNTGHGIEIMSNGVATISGNTITSNGGYGVYVCSGGTATLVGNTFSGNAAGTIWFQDRTNVALNKDVAADSEVSPYYAVNAVDGNKVDDASRWLSADTTDPHWIEVDLWDTYQIDEVRFWTGEGGYNSPLPDYEIDAWDGEDWVPIVVRTGNTSSEVVETFDPVFTNRLRLLNDPGIQVKLYEFEALTGGE
ncbi:MAG TPA: right-handed parallel beta-helix repeat-containing protein, partial [Sedimentisphaerales bacterium]|nr:right-handed parallel beta-helix repeat-containing protein [Sedimentisphaerales bacterium]